MVLKRRQMKSGTALFGFFAANDAELSQYLNSLPASERLAICSTLDGALQAPSESIFTRTFSDLLRAYFRYSDGSEAELRLRAITRMLGLVLQDKYRRDPAVIWERLWAESAGGPSRHPVEVEEVDIYDSAREELTLLLGETELSDEWISQSEIAHWVAGILAHRLIRSEADDALCVELRRILDEQDLAAATRAVSGLAWNFAFDGSIFDPPSTGDAAWLEKVRTGLTPGEESRADGSDWDELLRVRGAFVSADGGGTPTSYYMLLTRWIIKHLGVKLDDADLANISLHLTSKALDLRKQLAEAATQQ